MKQFFKILLVVAFFFANTPIIFAEDLEQKPSVEETTLFVNVTVLPMDGSGPIENARVLVMGDRIVSISKDLFLSHVNLIDGTGKFLVPGLAEMHGHIPGATRIDQNLEDLLFLYLANGVTTVRGMLGAPGQFELREKINRGEILGPTLYLGGPSFNGNSVSSPNQARRMVRDQAAAGWDFLKIHPGLTRAEYDAMADEATKLGMTWGGHVPQDVGLARALEAGQSTIDHLDGYDIYVNGVTTPLDQERLAEAVRMTLAAGAYVVPTNHLWETLLGLPEKNQLEAMEELKYVTPATRRQNRSRYPGQSSGQDLVDSRHNATNRRQILKALFDAGAGILLGSDAPQLYSVPGFSAIREMEAMADAGLTPEAILWSGTAAVGEFFSDKDSFGTIAPGQRADLILLDKNPLEDIANMRRVAGVMVRGTWLSVEEIEARLAEIEERNKGGAFF